MNVEILKNIFFALLGLSVIWLIRVLVKRESENLGRALVICALLGAGLLYLQHVKTKNLTISDVRAQIKNTFFPEKVPNYIFHREESGSGKGSYIRYYFESPGPKLSLEMDSNHKYFHIKDVYSVNRILEYLGLPKVETPARELASITGSASDLDTYRWDDYPLGTLVIDREICQDRDQFESYQCIANIVIIKK